MKQNLRKPKSKPKTQTKTRNYKQNNIPYINTKKIEKKMKNA